MENFSIKIYASSFVLQNDICSGGYFFQQNSELRRNEIYASSCVLPNDICSGGCSQHCSEFIRDPGEGSLDAEGGLEPRQDFFLFFFKKTGAIFLVFFVQNYAILNF